MVLLEDSRTIYDIRWNRRNLHHWGVPWLGMLDASLFLLFLRTQYKVVTSCHTGPSNRSSSMDQNPWNEDANLTFLCYVVYPRYCPYQQEANALISNENKQMENMERLMPEVVLVKELQCSSVETMNAAKTYFTFVSLRWKQLCKIMHGICSAAPATGTGS